MGTRHDLKRNDPAHNQRDQLERTPVVWEALRTLYERKVQNRMAKVEAAGGMTLTDLAYVETAEIIELDYLIRDPETPARLTERLISVKLQCRRHLRQILESLGDTGDVSNMDVIVPEGLRLIAGGDEGDEIS